MAELANARSMQPYIRLHCGCEKLAQGFYTAATWRGIEPRIYDTQVLYALDASDSLAACDARPKPKARFPLPELTAGVDGWPEFHYPSTLAELCVDCLINTG